MIDLSHRPSRNRRSSPSLVAPPPVWPLPSFGGRQPAFVPADPRIPGVDLAYPRATPDDMLTRFPVGSRHGSVAHFMPRSTPVLAVRDGVIRYASKQHHGYSVMIDHENRWATYYANLEHMFVLPNEQRQHAPIRIKAGDVLGYVGAPAPDAMLCLHFDLWHLDEDQHYASVDPRTEMPGWLVLPWTLSETGRFERAVA